MKEIILIHGLGQTRDSWNKTISYLPADIKATPLDLIAFCQGKETIYSNLYDAFKRCCNNSSEPLHLCGISLGAILALNYAIDHPNKVKSMLLIAPQYKMPRFLLKTQGLVFHLMPEKAFGETGFSKKDFSVLMGSMSNLDFSDTVDRISCPTLIVCGKNDKANAKAVRELATKIPQAKLRFIEHAGHEVNVDTPAELANTIKYFWG